MPRRYRLPRHPFPMAPGLFVQATRTAHFLRSFQATVFDPDAPLGVRQRPVRTEVGSAHVLVGSHLSAEAIQAVAAREGWRAQEVETGLFKIVKLWVEDVILVEFLAQG